MTLQNLEQVIAGGESETVEFKKSTAQLTRAGETLCAFLNCQGGRVFIGVTPEGRVVGQQITDSRSSITPSGDCGWLGSKAPTKPSSSIIANPRGTHSYCSMRR